MLVKQILTTSKRYMFIKSKLQYLYLSVVKTDQIKLITAIFYVRCVLNQNHIGPVKIH